LFRGQFQPPRDGPEPFVSGITQTQVEVGIYCGVCPIVRGLTFINEGDEIDGRNCVLSGFAKQFWNLNMLVLEFYIDVIDDVLSKVCRVILVNGNVGPG
jgi:hypothetical protein